LRAKQDYIKPHSADNGQAIQCEKSYIQRQWKIVISYNKRPLTFYGEEYGTTRMVQGISRSENDASAEMFKGDGGYAVMGRNAITCHPERTQDKVRKLYETQSFNVYSITKNGKKKLVYQAPYFVEGKFSGLVEVCLDLPDEIPHFDRDKK
jgi:hypothetical protein